MNQSNTRFTYGERSSIELFNHASIFLQNMNKEWIFYMIGKARGLSVEWKKHFKIMK